MIKTSLFDFYEIVKVVNPESEINELQGVILGKSECDKGNWGYAVHIFDRCEVFDVDEYWIESTGKKMKRSDIYDGTSILVKAEKLLK